MDFQPDVIHLHSSFAGIVGCASLGRRWPIAYTPHGYSFAMTSVSPPRRAVYRLLERLVAARTDLLIACSESEAALARSIGAPRVAVAINGIAELDAPTSRDLGNKRPAVIAVGRAGAQRRAAACARILGSLKDEAHVCWVGGGDKTSPAVQALSTQGVEMTGWLGREQVLERLANATVYLHWTAWDGLPLTVLEALAVDTIVIASDIPANREVLGPSQVVSSEHDAAALARRILRDPDLQARLLQSQRSRSMRFSSVAMTDALEAAYRRLGAGRVFA